ncbi:phosphatidylinositol alpha-1,6-mannosyltransferase [Salinimicrobium sediminis]|uniref:Phosphatidylinositol alpha-1,6-mannosyltransferase n=1 Tax=Salinimicrobium sediminis TaxID=1343891 RepID=A0A285WZK7_9FLAO|nr:glycosyltransferase family 4 protein [Salinimicrobium sediminis]SOC78551.1 phosphatidylinositol alpha-1,6-mannosyltransferase [Salinimicrobium sediminis]
MSLSKISIFTSEFPPQPGGIGNHSYNLAQGLADHGYTVTVLTDRRSAKGEEESKFDAALEFQVIRIPRKKLMILSYLHRIKMAFYLAGRSEVILASGKFQLWLGALLSFCKKKKNIAIVHGSELLLPHKGLRSFTEFSLRRFDKVISVSNFTKSLLKLSSLKEVHVIHNGFRLFCSPMENSRSETGPILITVGNVTQRKGQQNVIKTLPRLLEKYPDLRYYIVGIPSEIEKLQNLARELEVEKAVVFCGAVSEAEKCTLLGKADIFMMLSENTEEGDVEGFGIAILEANSLGIPSVGSKGCGIEEAVQDGFSGLVVNKSNTEEVFAAVNRILEDYQEYSSNAMEWAQKFRWENVVGKYIQILEE